LKRDVPLYTDDSIVLFLAASVMFET